MPKIYADFHNADSLGRIRLNCAGTTVDLSRARVELKEGISLLLYADDADSHGRPEELLIDGVVTYSQQENCWVAVVDWNAIRRAPQSSESRPISVIDAERIATNPVTTPR